jgi:Domain of unknown function (DUF4440)
MKLLLPFGVIFAMWMACGGLTDNKEAPKEAPVSEKPASNQPAKPAQDRDSVRRDLVRLATDIANAAKDGDISYLSKIATDDFQLTDVDGKIKTKNQALAEIKQEKNIRSFDIIDDKLVSLEDSSAVLTYTLKVYAKNGRSARAGTTDTYVKQDGKWMLKSEQQTLLK